VTLSGCDMTADKLALIAGVCIFTAALCRVFDNGAKEYGVMVKTAAAVGIMWAVVMGVMPVIERLEAIFVRSGADPFYFTVLLKGLGICFLTRLAGDICRDSGEGALAVQAETAGRTSLLVIALPLFEKAADLAAGLMDLYEKAFDDNALGGLSVCFRHKCGSGGACGHILTGGGLRRK